MKLILESTDLIETVNGSPARVWKGKTETGIECHVWISAIAVAKTENQAEFERELKSIAVERRVTSFDMRIVL